MDDDTAVPRDRYVKLSFRIARLLLRTGHWARHLPKHELQLLQTVLRSEYTWRQFITLDIDETRRRQFYHKLLSPVSSNTNINNDATSERCNVYSHITIQLASSTSTTKRKTVKKDADRSTSCTAEQNTFISEKKEPPEMNARKMLDILNFRVRTLISDYITNMGLFWSPPCPFAESESESVSVSVAHPSMESNSPTTSSAKRGAEDTTVARGYASNATSSIGGENVETAENTKTRPFAWGELDDIYMTLEDHLDDCSSTGELQRAEQSMTTTHSLDAEASPCNTSGLIDVTENELNENNETQTIVSSFSGNNSNSTNEREKKTASTGIIVSRELRGLLADVKTSGIHKWDYLAGYPELRQLYIALDRVLTELKAYKQHSFPFLKRVSKAEAHDYYDVIREPMDLSTMTKQLNAHKYFSKAEFQHDLDLIFSNCRTYNQNPDSPYLVHAAELEKKSVELMLSVPDIDLTASRDVILEDINRCLPPSKERKEHRAAHDTLATKDLSSTSPSSSPSPPSPSSSAVTNSARPMNSRHPNTPTGDSDTGLGERTRRLRFYTEDPTLTRIKQATRPYRLKTLINWQTTKENTERPALLFGDFLESVPQGRTWLWEAGDEHRVHATVQRLIQATMRVYTRLNVHRTPDISSSSFLNFSNDQHEKEKASYKLKEPNEQKEGEENTKAEEDISTLDEEEDGVDEQHVTGDYVASELSSELAANFLSRAIALYLLALGFESAQQTVLEVLTEVVGDYIANIGRLLRVECDANGVTTTTKMTTTSRSVFLLGRTPPHMIELVDRAIAEVCLNGLDGLKEFLAEDLLRFRNKLCLVPEHLIERYLSFAREAQQRRLTAERLLESIAAQPLMSSGPSKALSHGVAHYRLHAHHIPFARKFQFMTVQNPRHFLYHQYQMQLHYQQQQFAQQQQQVLLLQQQQQVLQQVQQQQQQQALQQVQQQQQQQQALQQVQQQQQQQQALQQVQQLQQVHQQQQQQALQQVQQLQQAQHHQILQQMQHQQNSQGMPLPPLEQPAFFDPSRVKIKTETSISPTPTSLEPASIGRGLVPPSVGSPLAKKDANAASFTSPIIATALSASDLSGNSGANPFVSNISSHPAAVVSSSLQNLDPYIEHSRVASTDVTEENAGGGGSGDSSRVIKRRKGENGEVLTAESQETSSSQRPQRSTRGRRLTPYPDEYITNEDEIGELVGDNNNSSNNNSTSASMPASSHRSSFNVSASPTAVPGLLATPTAPAQASSSSSSPSPLSSLRSDTSLPSQMSLNRTNSTLVTPPLASATAVSSMGFSPSPPLSVAAASPPLQLSNSAPGSIASSATSLGSSTLYVSTPILNTVAQSPSLPSTSHMSFAHARDISPMFNVNLNASPLSNTSSSTVVFPTTVNPTPSSSSSPSLTLPPSLSTISAPLVSHSHYQGTPTPSSSSMSLLSSTISTDNDELSPDTPSRNPSKQRKRGSRGRKPK
jgi:hypothetical protein